MSKIISEILVEIKKQKPFIFNITNYYNMNFVADGIRSMGAIPIMSNAEKEIEALLKLCQSVVINLGKLDDKFILLCKKICLMASQLEKPVILDPTGAGVSEYRTDISLSLIADHKISIVRAYKNEIMALSSESPIDPLSATPIDNHKAIKSAQSLSKKYDVAVVMNGKENMVIDGDEIDNVSYDLHFLNKVAGIGGLLSSIIGVFHGIEKNRFNAALSAVNYYGVCVKRASTFAEGPASFKTKLIDNLFQQTSNAY